MFVGIVLQKNKNCKESRFPAKILLFPAIAQDRGCTGRPLLRRALRCGVRYRSACVPPSSALVRFCRTAPPHHWRKGRLPWPLSSKKKTSKAIQTFEVNTIRLSTKS